MANLLDQASIVLTPTAYDNGKVLCAKPSEAPYGDFDFSRNSAATRVNAQGLVENVQILSSNLVQNGDFSELGTEEISNGSFSQEGVEIADDSTITNAGGSIMTKVSALNYNATSDGTGASSIRPRLFFNDVTTGNFYRIRVSGTNQSGSVNFKLYDGNAYIVEDNDLTTDIDLYFEAKSTSVFIAFDGTNPFNVDFTISLKEVGQDWTLETGWSIAEDKAVAVSGASSKLRQLISGLSGKTCKVSFTLSDFGGSGSVRVDFGSVSSDPINTNGVHIVYGTYDNNAFELFKNGSFSGSITNISVKEVGQNWDLGTGWAIGNNVAISDATQGYIVQTDVGGAGVTATYKIQWVQNITAGTRLRFFARNYNDGGNATILSITRDDGLIIGGGNCIGSGTFTAYVSSTNGYSFKLLAEAGVEADITNITTIQITDDTNLPRINYEGFSYQDALGSELVVNGGFDTDSDWDLGTGWSIGGGEAVALNSASGQRLRQDDILQVGKIYKLTYEVKSISSGGFRAFVGGVALQQIYNIGVYTETMTTPTINDDFFIRTLGTTTGSIDNVSVKEYLGQEVVPDSGCGSWLFEPQSTNLITYSEDFSDSSWSKNAISATSGFTSPSGDNSAFKISGTGGSSYHNIRTSISTTNSTVSCFVKKGTLNHFEFIDTIGGSPYSVVQYNLEEVTANINVAGVFLNPKIEDYGNGWYRCSAEATATASIHFNISKGSTDGTGLIEANDYLYIWGAQLEQQTYATSYIPTSGTSVTRNQDVCTGGGSLATINSTEGVLYAEIAALADDGTNRRISLSDDTNNNRVVIYYATSNDLLVLVRVANTTSFSYTFNTDTKQFLKIGLKWKQDDFALWVNGVKLAGDTSGNTFPENTLNDFSFTDGSGTTLPFFGKTKAIAVWKEALSDEELADLTYPTPTDPTFSLDFDTIAEQFTFTRGSEATYVDAQGLIQSTNELGAEQITNGDFSTDGIPSTTSWSLGWYSQTSNVLISGGKLTLTNSASQSSALAYATDGVSSLNVITINKTYKLQYRVIENNGVTSFKYYSAGGSFIAAPTDLGVTHTIYIKNTANQIFLFQNATTNSSISIDNVSVKEHITATNTPRLDYSTGAEAFLLEPQSTNLIPYSEDFSQWDVINTPIITSNYGVSPDGTQNADRLQMNTNDRIYTSVPASGNTAFSVYLKGSGIITLRDSTNVYRQDVTLTSEWERYSLYFNATSNNVQIQNQKVGDVDCEIWGAQVEALSYPTSYIPTSGTTVTRNQETCINATPEINSEEGTLYFEGSALVNGDTSRIIGLSDGTNDNLIYIRFDLTASRFYGFARGGGGSYTSVLKNGINQTDYNKVALVWNATNLKIWINGSEQDTATINNLPIAINTLDFTSPTGSNNFFGNTKDLQVYTKALSDAELIKLTT